MQSASSATCPVESTAAALSQLETENQVPSAKTVADFERLLPFRHNVDSS
jgi:hypothetical protein